MSAAKKTKKRDYKPLLKEIVEFLNVGDEEAAKLAVVLSALRGPDRDFSSSEIKSATTCVIRHKIGMKRFRWHLLADDNLTAIGWAVLPDDEEKRKIRLVSKSSKKAIPGFHFEDHAKDAFDVLGLKWDKVNK